MYSLWAMCRFPSVLLALFFCITVPALTVSADAIKIGVSLPLTGPAASYGLPLQKILEFLNSESGSAKYQLIFEDDRCDPKEGVTVAKRFVATPGVSIVFGSPCSGVMLASAPIYERAKIVVIDLGAGAPSISQAGDYIFRARPSDLGSAQILARYLKQKVKRLAILAEQTEYAQQLADFVSSELKHSELTIFREDFISDSIDLPSILLRLKSKQFDALLALPQAEKGLIDIVKKISQAKEKFPVYGSAFPGSPTFLTAVGDDAEGIEFATLPDRNDGLTAAGREKLRRFEQKSGRLTTVDYAFGLAESGFQAADQTISSGKDWREYLYSARFRGAIGEFSFDRSGDLVGMNYVIQRIEHGKPVTVFR